MGRAICSILKYWPPKSTGATYSCADIVDKRVRFFVLFCALAAPVLAQVTETTGVIWGVVKDGGTGAVLAGVQMVLTGDTGTLQTSTSLTGDYHFSNVKP